MAEVGDIVLYRLRAADIHRIEAARDSTEGFVGERHQPTDVVPAIVVATFEGGAAETADLVTGQAFLLGNDSLWFTGHRGDNDGEWQPR